MVLSPVLRVVDNVSGLLASVTEFRRKRKNTDTSDMDTSEHVTVDKEPKKLKLTPVSIPAAPRTECPQCKAGLPGHISHILS